MVRIHVRPLTAHLCVALFGLTGCGDSGLPKTYPAGGTVVYQGGRPLNGGTIQFKSTSDPLLRVLAEIKNDGAFTLRTVKENAHGAGAPVGEYQVTVQPPRPPHAPDDYVAAQQRVDPITLPDTYKIEAKDNAFKIALNVPPPS